MPSALVFSGQTKRAASLKETALLLSWCRGRELNSHGVATATSRQRVYQFHHPDAQEDFYWKAGKNASKNSEKFFLSRKGHGTGVKRSLRGEMDPGRFCSRRSPDSGRRKAAVILRWPCPGCITQWAGAHSEGGPSGGPQEDRGRPASLFA